MSAFLEAAGLLGDACSAVEAASQVEFAPVARPSVFSVRLGTSDEAAAVQL